MALRVLVADHSESISKAIELSLESFATKVKSFVPNTLKDTSLSSLKAGILEMAKTFQPDIIFLDTLLSKINGYEVSHALKSNEQFKSVPVVLMYSSVIGIDQTKAKASGAEATLEKPFTQEQLQTVVKKFCQLSSVPLDKIKDMENPPIEAKTFPDPSSDQIRTTGFINTASELKDLEKALSESDEDEDFQQISLEKISPSKDNKNNLLEGLSEDLDFPKEESSDTETLSDFSETDLDLLDDIEKPEEVKTANNQHTPQANGITSTEALPDMDQDALSLDLEDDIEVEVETDETELEKIEINATANQTITNKEAKQNTPPQTEKPKEIAASFRLNIPESAIKKEDSLEMVEPEEEITNINFLTSPEEVQQKEKINHEQTFKKRGLEEVQAHLNQTSPQAIPSQKDFQAKPLKKADQIKDTQETMTASPLLEDQVKDILSSQKDLQTAVQNEIKALLQDHIQRFLRDELPAMAQKLIKEEVDRLLSENTSS